MIKEHKTVELFGKKIFEKVRVSDILKNPNPLDNEACFLYVIEGSNQSYSEDRSLVVHSHDGVLMKCGNYIYKGVPDKSTKTLSFLAIHLHPEVLLKLYENNYPEFLKQTAGHHSGVTMTAIRSNHYIGKFMESLLLYMDHPTLMDKDMIQLKLKEFIQLLLYSMDSKAVSDIMFNLFNQRTIAFKETIKAHIFSDLRIKDLAVLTNQSLASFKREFKKHFDDSPANYIKQERLRHAAELLLITNDRITEIAYECQFHDPAHFSTCFKEKYGMSPKEYRVSRSEK